MSAAQRVLGRRGYVVRKDSLTPERLEQCRRDLTYTIEDEYTKSVMKRAQTKPEEFPIYAENTKKIYLPRYYGLEQFGEPDRMDFEQPAIQESERAALMTPFTFQGSLRDYQEAAVAQCMERFHTTGGGGLLCMPCGFGKTRTTIHLIYRLQREYQARGQPFRAIVVVHKEFLGEQWRENIQNLIPEARVGSIQQDRVDVVGRNIVIAMLQSICLKEYPDSLFGNFDFAIFDECHHLAAQVFSRALLRVGSRHLLGLSATPSRKDGFHSIFFRSLGSIIYRIEREEEDRVFVKRIDIRSDQPEYEELRMDRTGTRNTIGMINNLCSFQDRNRLIVDTMQILMREVGRKIILLSARRDDKHLNDIRALIESSEQTMDAKGQVVSQSFARWDGQPVRVGFYLGRKGENKKNYKAGLKASEGCDIILATYDIAKEGLDISGLNTIILGTPINGLIRKQVRGEQVEDSTVLEQSIGRILREPIHLRRLIPIVVDFVDRFANFPKWYYTRNAFYKKMGYPVHSFSVELTGSTLGNTKSVAKRYRDLQSYFYDNRIFNGEAVEAKEDVEETDEDDDFGEEMRIVSSRSKRGVASSSKCMIEDEE